MMLRRLLVLLLALALVPITGRALPIEEPGEYELLVEGHTVFMTIDAIQYDDSASASAYAPTRPSPEEGPSTLDATGVRYVRFPGVSWFNDQYLVAPHTESYETLGPSKMTSVYASAMTVLVRADDGEGIREPCGGALLAWQEEWDPRAIDFADPATSLLDLTYVESYRVTDPNAHAWVVDMYLVDETIPLWVANLLGGETFVPDTPDRGLPLATDDCSALADADAAALALDGATCEFGTDVGLHVDVLQPPTSIDDPCMDYMEPGRAGHCYGGQQLFDGDSCEDQPRRRHTGLLYFRWEDLRSWGVGVDHCGIDYETFECRGSWWTDTNGCEEGTEWTCPEWYGDFAEGNSHSFHPDNRPHVEGEACALPGGNPVNHGVQLNLTEGAPAHCSYYHEVADMQVFYSGESRPLAPLARIYAVDDRAGASDPFGDFHAAYGS